MGAETGVVVFIYPVKTGGVERKQLPWIKGKTLLLYFKELGLQARRLNCHIVSKRLPKDTPPLRTSYVPWENETIHLIPTGAGVRVV